MVDRDAELRRAYLDTALAAVPRLLGAVDRNPYRPTYGCFDREFWHYRTSAFASEMYQEAVHALALVYKRRLPGNRWYGQPRLRELAIAGMRFAARHCHADTSCDDYYPYERALGAAVFSLVASASAYRELRLDDDELRTWLVRRARWVAENDETGRLTNHHAVAGWGLALVAEISGCAELSAAGERRMRKVVDWQSAEGWFEEYGGADPGYQTVTIDALAKYRRLTAATWLDEPLARAVDFARLFLHPDGSYGGEYGSRGTYHFYPHGFELLAATNAAAADLADGHLVALSTARASTPSDDRLYTHPLASMIQAYCDWAPRRQVDTAQQGIELSITPLRDAGIVVVRGDDQQTVVSPARGGVIKHFAAAGEPRTDAGLVVELGDGRVCVSQQHDRGREWSWQSMRDGGGVVTMTGPLDLARFETVTPLKQAVLHMAMISVGRWCRGLVRLLLQRRLITGHDETPIELTRSVRFVPDGTGRYRIELGDVVRLTRFDAKVRRMSFGTDHQSVYTAATGVYQRAVLESWTDLGEYVDRLNRDREVVIEREWRA
jgi:hypothetical protein